MRDIKGSDLDQPDGLAQYQLCVLLELGTQLDPAEMSLEEQVCFHVRIIELAGLQLVGQPRGQVPQQRVLAVPDGQVLVLRRGRDNLGQAADLGLVVLLQPASKPPISFTNLCFNYFL